MSIDVNEYVNDIWSFVIYDDTYWSEIYAKFKSEILKQRLSQKTTTRIQTKSMFSLLCKTSFVMINNDDTFLC